MATPMFVYMNIYVCVCHYCLLVFDSYLLVLMGYSWHDAGELLLVVLGRLCNVLGLRLGYPSHELQPINYLPGSYIFNGQNNLSRVHIELSS